jgi:hypothetical protein
MASGATPGATRGLRGVAPALEKGLPVDLLRSLAEIAKVSRAVGDLAFLDLLHGYVDSCPSKALRCGLQADEAEEGKPIWLVRTLAAAEDNVGNLDLFPFAALSRDRRFEPGSDFSDLLGRFLSKLIIV